MNKILKVFLSLLLLVGLSKQILSYEVTIISDGFVYTCFTYPGTHEVDISTCMANVKEVIICAEPISDAGIDDVGGGASGGTSGVTPGTGITPGGGGVTPTDPVDPVDPNPIDNPDLPLDCQCNVCPHCGGCIWEKGELKMVGCEPCKCCVTQSPLNFSCIHQIRTHLETKYLESTLWNTFIYAFNIILKNIDNNIFRGILYDIVTEFNLTDYMKVEMRYKKGRLSEWTGKLQYDCSSTLIYEVLEEHISFIEEGLLSNEVSIDFYKVNSITGAEEFLRTEYRDADEFFFTIDDITRDGFPEPGEPVYKEYKFN